jgi:hypothetical protein
MANTFQARLLAKMGRVSQKLVDQQIKLMGVITDVIRITGKFTTQSDYISRTVDDIDIIEIAFPGLKDVPMRRFVMNSGQAISANDAVSKEGEEQEPFECYAPVTSLVKQHDIILKFFENPIGDDPWILPLQCSDVMGTFGARQIIWQKMNLVYYAEELDPQIVTWCNEMAVRRQILNW